jgi:hypothetical protein
LAAAALAAACLVAATPLAAFAARLSALPAGFSRALRVVLEVAAAGGAAFAGNFAPLVFIHCRESAVRRAALVSSTILFSHDYSRLSTNGDDPDRRRSLIGLPIANEPAPFVVAQFLRNPCESLHEFATSR